MLKFKQRLIISSILAIGATSAHAANISEMFRNAVKGDNSDVIYESSEKGSGSKLENVTPVPVNPYTSMVQTNQPESRLPVKQFVPQPNVQPSAPVQLPVAPVPTQRQVSALSNENKQINVKRDADSLAPLLIETRGGANVKIQVDQREPEPQVVPYIKPVAPVLPEKAPNNPYTAELKVQYPAPPRAEIKSSAPVPTPVAPTVKSNVEPDALPNVRFVRPESPRPATWEPLRNAKEPTVISSSIYDTPKVLKTDKPEVSKADKPEVVTPAKMDKNKIKESLATGTSVSSKVLESKPGTHVSTPSKLTATEIEFIKLAKRESDLWAALDVLSEDDPAYMQQVLALNDLWAAQEELSKKTGVDPKNIEAVVAIQAASHKRSGEAMAKKTKVQTEVAKPAPKDIMEEIAKADAKPADKSDARPKSSPAETVVANEPDTKKTVVPVVKNTPKIVQADTSKAIQNDKVVVKPAVVTASKPLVLPSQGQVIFQSIDFGADSKPIDKKNKSGPKAKPSASMEQNSLPVPAEVKVTPIPDLQDAVIKTSLDK